jgi:hypothetical protein
MMDVCVVLCVVCCVLNYINILYIYTVGFFSLSYSQRERGSERSIVVQSAYRNRDNIKIDPGSAQKREGRGGEKEKALSQTFP